MTDGSQEASARHPMRSVARGFLAALIVLLGPALATAECPLSADECGGLIGDASDLGAGLARVREGEFLVERRVVRTEDGETDAVTGAFLIDAAPDRVWNVLCDYGSWPEFVPHLADVAFRREPAGTGSIAEVQQTTSVWIFDFRYTTRRVEDREGGVVWVELDPSEENDIQQLSGFWQIVPLDGGKRSLVRFQSRVDLGAPLPRWVKQRLLEQSVPTSMQALVDEVERRRDPRGSILAQSGQ